MTVRTLRYHEEIGLLSPESRTDAGHRQDGPEALEQLYKISMLRRLGLPLDAIRAGLRAEGTDGTDLRSLMTEHLATVENRLAAETRLRARLATLVGTLETTEDASGVLLNVLEDMTMLEATLERRIYREYGAIDLGGLLWSFMKPLG